MCGIVGYIGKGKAANILMEGLEKLEYRGYDSAGIAILNKNEMEVRKYKGRLKVLKESLEKNSIEGTIGIGHTRWATHGEPSDINSHPHLNGEHTIAVVHNGIIENFSRLKDELKEKGYNFLSETDTEVLPHLLDLYYDGDMVEAVKKVVNKVEGSYALAILDKNNPDSLIAVRKDSPLVIGLGDGENFIASDIPAILKYTRKVYILEDREMAVITKDKIDIMKTDGTSIEKEIYEVTWDVEAAEKMGYDHFMIKEIYEQPKAIKDTLSPRIIKEGKLKLDEVNLSREYLNNIDKVYIVACGTAYHAGLLGKSFIEEYAKVPVMVDVASEFRYSNPFIDDRTLMIVVSQSGETADTLAALRLGKERNAKVIAITNVVGSSVSREADHVLYTWAGPEIAVASTKAYTTQVAALALVALDIAVKRGTIDEESLGNILKELKKVSGLVEEIFKDVEDIKEVSNHICKSTNLFFIGRGIDYDVAREGSLKLKEVTYIHSEAMAAGELKHGTLALIEKDTPVIALATQDNLFDKMLSNIKEVKARGAYVVALAKEGNEEIEKSVDKVIYIPKILDKLAGILAVVPLQLLAYYVALERGCDIDKPKNLAKSVTVE
ncbi:glutamine--fructose-6-phosphate transaminase (isomerizing) [Tissierella sp. MSJ-40]|uniref:Glutamine--fructose-6-phosphate aminotransferase [isomerizing] n=1 Tax=Tissierella simiarum TaxID=2841534 RepID=A0ABS6E2T7_9FIRM|nr:glutamine--fructose-6-phosphate transaminase (isomerizing) [Tissierella simiarum]MBU5437097.1 glutamine--fructose-6-phosphate transaminase (isomerizing) [Tissierella simiarum]